MKIHLAGLSCVKDRKKTEKIPYVLESFYYFKDWEKKLIETADSFLLDSGAFTFMNSYKGDVDWLSYINSYADFINENKIDYFFELDIDNIVGYEKVKEYRKYLEEKTQKKSIPVWHKSRGINEWIEICEKYSYVAIGGIVTKEIAKKDYKYFKILLDIARKNNCKVHGLGFTNLKELGKYRFYSVDSTSWKSERFGNIYLFSNNELKTIKRTENQRLKSKNGYPAKIQSHNLEQWMKFQKFMDM